MSTKKRLRALNGIDYPDAQSLPIVRRAGGLRKLTPEQRAKVTITRRETGDWCDGMPEVLRARYLASGDVEEVEVGASESTTAAPPNKRRTK